MGDPPEAHDSPPLASASGSKAKHFEGKEDGSDKSWKGDGSIRGLLQ